MTMSILFKPFGIIAGVAAGLAARKLFEKGWEALDTRDPPQPDQSDIQISRLVVALLLEGAIFSLVKGLVDHGARAGFARYTGVWPGEKTRRNEVTG